MVRIRCLRTDFAVCKSSLRIASRLALLLKCPSGGDSLIELFANALGGYGVRNSMSLSGSISVDVFVNTLNCLERHGAGSVRIELSGHSSMALDNVPPIGQRTVIAEFRSGCIISVTDIFRGTYLANALAAIATSSLIQFPVVA